MADITIFANAALPLLLNMSSQVVYFKVTDSLTVKDSILLLMMCSIRSLLDMTNLDCDGRNQVVRHKIGLILMIYLKMENQKSTSSLTSSLTYIKPINNKYQVLTIVISPYSQLEKNGLLSMVFFDLLLRYMRVLMLFSSISERKMIFALYSTAVQFVPPIVDYAVPHLNKYVLLFWSNLIL
jgi:Membrane-associated apoptosis protein